MESPDFPKRIKDYLDERFKGELYQPYEVRIGDVLGESLKKEELKWSVFSWGPSSHTVDEDVNGRIWIVSGAIELIDGWVEDYLIHSSELKKILEDLQDKRNWKKYEGKFRELIARLRWEDRIASSVSKKTGVDVSLFIPSDFYFKYCYFYSVFDASNMTDDQKMEEIKKRMDAVVLAYESWNKNKGKFYRRRIYL